MPPVAQNRYTVLLTRKLTISVTRCQVDGAASIRNQSDDQIPGGYDQIKKWIIKKWKLLTK
jgi:hypothetical protein